MTPPPEAPHFSKEPTDEEIFRARVFEEPLVPMGRPTSAEENEALASALVSYLDGGSSDALGGLEAFLSAHPASSWRPALLLDMGIVYRRTGYFTKALGAWKQAWDLSKGEIEPKGKAVADRSLADLATLDARLGRVEDLESLLGEAQGRDIHGSASEKLNQAREGLWLMQHKPERSFRCGPLALDRILALARKDEKSDPKVLAYPSTSKGTSLFELKKLAESVGVKVKMAKRVGDAEIILPALVHWKAGHYAALVRQQGERYLSHDPTFGDDIWITRKALNEETTGYHLILDRSLPKGWEKVGDQEGRTVWGKGAVPFLNPGSSGSNNNMTPQGSGGPPCGMPVYRFHTMLVNLNIRDMPIGYTPPIGPAMQFQVTYNQKEVFQPQTFYYSNLGPKWTFDWISYLEDDPSNPGADLNLYERGGGRLTSTGYDASSQSYAPEPESRAVIVRVTGSPIRYERRLPDGSLEVFAQPDGAATFPRKVFMTSWSDPRGNAVSLTYDSSLRIVAATDAIGQVTTVSYENSADPLKITRVTDPFGRGALFEYNAAGELSAITDVIGMRSSFEYNAGDFISAMTTPYGTTRFELVGEGDPTITPGIQATDPLGGVERLEFERLPPPGAGLLASEPASAVPTGLADYNHNLDLNNSVFWDKRAMALYPGDYTKARITHWLWGPGQVYITDTKHSEKLPLENRFWYAYPGQTDPSVIGTSLQPSKIARVLDNGTSQIYRTEYGPRGNVTRETDPVGRTTIYNYDTNGIDLLEIRQVNGQTTDLLKKYTYNSGHQRLTETDVSGQTTSHTYTASGDIQTAVTPPHGGLNAAERTTTYEYFPVTDLAAPGRLNKVTGPTTSAGAPTTSYTYDGFGRIRTVTNSDSYTATYDYDALDRITKVTYPDGTYEQTVYNRLDAEQVRDPLGRWTHMFYDALRQVVAVRDPLGQTTTYSTTSQGCNCGSLDKVTDPEGNTIQWEKDLQGRLAKEIRADNSQVLFTYENTTSRLKSRTDAKQQVTNYEYLLDDTLKRVTYANAQNPTASVSYTYDPFYKRTASMTDGTGTTTFSYNPATVPPSLGATLTSSIDGPLDNDTITFSYDETGRVTTRAINAVPVTVNYDALGRVTGETNSLGSFAYGYAGVSGRPAAVTYPGGQSTTYSYYDNTGNRRLQEIRHSLSSGATLSRFSYTYDVIGNIRSLTQQTDSNAAQAFEYDYDSSDRLATATLKTTGPTPTILKRYGYAYDKVGNRTTEQIDDTAVAATHNGLNQLRSQDPGGLLRFAGSLSEPAAVTIQTKPAQVGTDNKFQGSAAVGAGNTTVAVTATDASGNARTNTYQVGQSGASKTFTYDLNGNLMSDGARTFEWDAENRLLAVNAGTKKTEFTYDGQSRRTRIVEKDGGLVTGERRFVWCETTICEERDATGAVTKRFYGNGMQDGAEAIFYTRDHLGSVRELTDASGALRARYDYDPFGRTVKVSGDKDSPFAFTGHYVHWATGLVLAPYRVYDAGIGRWLSEDPLGLEGGGLNLYAYAGNSPLGGVDPLGLIDSRQALEHYILGTGTPLRMSFSDIDTSSVKPSQFPAVKGMLKRGPGGKCPCPGTQKSITTKIDDKMPFETSGDQALFLGTITLRLEGDLTIYTDCTWCFKGTLKAFDDWYDFNPSTHRKLLAEILTRLGGKLRGKPYWIEIRGSKPMTECGYIPK